MARNKTPLFRVALQPLPSERLDVLAADEARRESGGTPNRARTMSALINAAWEQRERAIAECRKAIRDAARKVDRSPEQQVDADQAATEARARLRKFGLDR
jgi:hypothetical protein